MRGVVSNKLDSLISLIPELFGKKGIGLDEVDRAFRSYLSEKVVRGKERMEEIRREFSDDGKIGLVGVMERSIKRLNKIGDSLIGDKYSHDAVESIPMEGLDRIYSFDMTLLEEVDKLDLMVEEIATSDGYEAKVREEIKKLEQYLNEVEELLSKRGELLRNP